MPPFQKSQQSIDPIISIFLTYGLSHLHGIKISKCFSLNSIIDPTASSLGLASYHAQEMGKVLNTSSLLNARSPYSIYPHLYTHFLGMTFDYHERCLYRRLTKYVIAIKSCVNEPILETYGTI